MKLSINKEQAKSSVPFFGANYKVTARLEASAAEIEAIAKRSLGGFELAKLPNSMGPKYAAEPLYLGEILNRDWEHKCQTMAAAEATENMVIQACRDLKARLELPDASAAKVIEL